MILAGGLYSRSSTVVVSATIAASSPYWLYPNLGTWGSLFRSWRRWPRWFSVPAHLSAAVGYDPLGYPSDCRKLEHAVVSSVWVQVAMVTSVWRIATDRSASNESPNLLLVHLKAPSLAGVTGSRAQRRASQFVRWQTRPLRIGLSIRSSRLPIGAHGGHCVLVVAPTSACSV